MMEVVGGGWSLIIHLYIFLRKAFLLIQIQNVLKLENEIRFVYHRRQYHTHL